MAICPFDPEKGVVHCTPVASPSGRYIRGLPAYKCTAPNRQTRPGWRVIISLPRPRCRSSEFPSWAVVGGGLENGHQLRAGVTVILAVVAIWPSVSTTESVGRLVELSPAGSRTRERAVGRRAETKKAASGPGGGHGDQRVERSVGGVAQDTFSTHKGQVVVADGLDALGQCQCLAMSLTGLHGLGE